MELPNTIFNNGTCWLRADFHLHTNTASEFKPKEDTNKFPQLFIDKLIEQDIRIACITNHNKFDIGEFKAIRKLAKQNEIYVLPSIEFSVNEGAKGIHILIVFDDSWYQNIENKNYIQDFITGAFQGKANYDTPEYPNSNYNFKQTVNALDLFQKNYFIVLAHVDGNNGLYDQLNGRGLEDFLNAPEFERVLAFQKLWTTDNKVKLKNTKGQNFSIAEVEGSDNAAEGLAAYGISNKRHDITQNTFIKIGDYNLDALKFALKFHQNRTAKSIPKHNSPYITSIEIKNKVLGENAIIHLNAEMNNFIGIRGSGKSSLLEAIRYGLDIQLNNGRESANENQIEYKRKLVEHFLGSGGKITLNIIDNETKYTIIRRLNDPIEVFRDGIQVPYIEVKSIIKCLYFGQKDLTYYGDQSTAHQLVNRLIGEKLVLVRADIGKKHNDIKQLLDQHNNIVKNLADENLFKQKKAEIDNKLQDFKAKEVDKLLSKQSQYQKDQNYLNSILTNQVIAINAIEEVIQQHQTALAGFDNYTSSENDKLISEVKINSTNFQTHFNQLNSIVKELTKDKLTHVALSNSFTQQYETLKDEFAEIKRKIDIPNLEPDTYLKLTNEADLISKQLTQLTLLLSQKTKLETSLISEISQLRGLWEKELDIINIEIKRVNSLQNKIELSAEFKQEKTQFKDFIKKMCYGSNIREDKFVEIAKEFSDLTEFITNPASAKDKIQKILSDTQISNFYTALENNKFEFITYRVPDKYDVKYDGEALENHSLGQKATALIIFILALKEHQLIMIDQPEDDLDNQTIYDQVIVELKKLKPQTQFIFATHNPNIPVLGDCEQIIACSEHNKHIKIECGSIDKKTIQENIIKIMEGGKEAFKIRKQKYDQWTP